ncbi:MAG: hypothetical protein ACPGSO_00615 [Vicingaceae bacterium]
MAAIAGDITEITYNHPTLGTGVFYPKANEDNTFDPGGFRAEDDVNMIDGGGRVIQKKNRVRWSVENLVSWDMNGTDELNVARKLTESNVDAEWTFSHISGAIYKGLGVPVGELQGNGNAATFTLKISGGGVLEKIGG